MVFRAESSFWMFWLSWPDYFLIRDSPLASAAAAF